MTQDSYLDQLGAWMTQRLRARSRQDGATVAFLAVRGDVKAAMDAGYTLSAIYTHMKESGRIRMSFETFRTHARKFSQPTRAAPVQSRVTPSVQAEAGASTPAGASAESTPVREPAHLPLRRTPPGMAGFDFNATPDKKDLF